MDFNGEGQTIIDKIWSQNKTGKFGIGIRTMYCYGLPNADDHFGISEDTKQHELRASIHIKRQQFQIY